MGWGESKVTVLSGLWAMGSACWWWWRCAIGIRQILDEGVLERIHSTIFTNCWNNLFVTVDCWPLSHVQLLVNEKRNGMEQNASVRSIKDGLLRPEEIQGTIKDCSIRTQNSRLKLTSFWRYKSRHYKMKYVEPKKNRFAACRIPLFQNCGFCYIQIKWSEFISIYLYKPTI